MVAPALEAAPAFGVVLAWEADLACEAGLAWEADPAWVVPALEAVLVAWEVGHLAVAFVDTIPTV